MNTTKRIALASVLTTTILAVAGSTTFAADDGSRTPDAASVPSDWVPLTDDTGMITVSVPPTWTDASTTPWVEEAGVTLPSIAASTDLAAYWDTFDVAGTLYNADIYTPDTEAAAEKWGLTSGCDDQQSAPYDDGAFIGTHVSYTGCGDGSAQFHVVAANPDDAAFTAIVQVQLTGSDDPAIVDGILASFNRVSGATSPVGSTPPTAPAGSTPVVPTVPTVVPTPTVPAVPTPTVPAVPTPTDPAVPTPTDPGVTFTLPTVPAVPELPGESGVPADWTWLMDDSGTIGLAVPPSWTAVNTVASDDGNPWISATTDDGVFFADTDEQYTVPGVVYMAAPFNADTEAVNAEFAGGAATACTDSGSEPYDDGLFVGDLHTWTNCGGTETTIYQIAANPPDQAFTAALMIQLTGQPDDAATLTALQLAFGFAGAGTTVAGPVTTVADAPTTAALSELDPAAEFQERMESSGLTLDYDQASCWLDAMMQMDDTPDTAALQAAGEGCGVTGFPG